METLSRLGAEIFLWPVGGTGSASIMIAQAEKIASLFSTPVAATQLSQAIDMGAPSAAVIDAQGNKYENTMHTQIDLTELQKTYGYTGTPFIISTLM